MPRVPTLDGFQQRVAPLAPAFQSAQTNADQFGAAQGRGLTEAGLGLQQVGDRLGDEALRLAIERNEAAARAADAEAATALRDILHAPESGYFALRGRDAVDRQAETEQRIRAAFEGIADGLPTDRARALFRVGVQPRVDNALTDIARHSREQHDAFVTGSMEARVETAFNDALTSFNDPMRIQESLAVGEAQIADMADRNGWDAKQTQAALERFRSAVHTGIVQRFIDNGRTQDAVSYLRDNRSHITGVDAAALDETLHVATTRERATTLTDQIIDDARSGRSPAVAGVSGARGGLPETLPRATDALAAAVVGVESDGDDGAIGDSGTSFGAGQIQIATARGIANYLGDTHIANASDEEIRAFLLNGKNNRHYSRAHLDQLLAAFDGDTMLAIMAYNMGEGGVRSALRRHGDPRTGEISHDAFLAAVDAQFNHREPNESDEDGRGNPARHYQRVMARLEDEEPTGAGVGRPDAPQRVISYGDSIAVGMGVVDGVENRGVGGAGFSNGQLPDLGEIETGDAVLISVGSNDANAMSVEDYAAALTDLINRVHNAGGVAVVTGLNRAYGDSYRLFDDAAVSVAEITGAVYVPSETPDGGDRLHFSPAGYERRVSAALDAMAAVRPSLGVDGDPVATEPTASAATAIGEEPGPGWYERAYRDPRWDTMTPEEQAIGRSILNAEYGAEQRIESERIAADRDTAWAHIDDGGSFDTLSPDLVARIGRRDPVTLAALERASLGGNVVTDRQVYGDLMDMIANDPAGFMSVDLRQSRGLLAPTDYNRLRSLQAGMIAERQEAAAESRAARLAPTEIRIPHIRAVTRTLLIDAGVIGRTGVIRDAKAAARFEAYMIDRAEAFREAEGQDPSDGDLIEMAQIALVPVTTWRFEDGAAGEAISGRQFETWVGYNDIPPNDRHAIELLLIEEEIERLVPGLPVEEALALIAPGASSEDAFVWLRPRAETVEEVFNQQLQEAGQSGQTLEGLLAGRPPPPRPGEVAGRVIGRLAGGGLDALPPAFVEPTDAEAEAYRAMILRVLEEQSRFQYEDNPVPDFLPDRYFDQVLRLAEDRNVPIDVVMRERGLWLD